MWEQIVGWGSRWSKENRVKGIYMKGLDLSGTEARLWEKGERFTDWSWMLTAERVAGCQGEEGHARCQASFVMWQGDYLVWRAVGRVEFIACALVQSSSVRRMKAKCNRRSKDELPLICEDVSDFWFAALGKKAFQPAKMSTKEEARAESVSGRM